MSEQPTEARDRRQSVISHAMWDHAISAVEGNLPSAALERCAEEDVHAVVETLIERLDDAGLTVVSRDRIGMFLMSYATGGDEADPWQAGHNYAMGEAARMVLECWDLLEAPPAAPSPSVSDKTGGLTAEERITAGRIKHGVGASEDFPGNVCHLVSPIVGNLRLRKRDGGAVPDLGWIIDRLSLVLDMARQEAEVGADRDATLARVESLAEEWEHYADPLKFYSDRETERRRCGAALRAALHPDPSPEDT